MAAPWETAATVPAAEAPVPNRLHFGTTTYGRGHTPPAGHKPTIIVEGDCTEIPIALKGRE